MAKKEVKEKEQTKVKASAEKVKDTVEKAKETVEKTTEAASDKIKETAATIKETVSHVAAKKTAAVKENCFIEFNGKQVSVSDITAKAKKMYNGEIKTLSVYVKPEDSKVYYVINDIEHGDFDI